MSTTLQPQPAPNSGTRRADEGVAALVAAGGVEDRRDVLGDGLDAERVGDEAAEAQAVGIGIALRHQHAEHLLRPERRDRERGADAGVDAAGKPEHDAAPPQAPQHLLAHRARRCARPRPWRRGASQSPSSVASPSRRRKLRRGGIVFIAPAAISPAAISRRSIFPFSDFGSASRNSTDLRHHEILEMPGAVRGSRRRASSSTPGSSATTALIACPSIGSGTPTTAASRTPGSA